MNPFSRFLKKLSILLGRKRFLKELDEEMAYHRAQAEQEFIAAHEGVGERGINDIAERANRREGRNLPPPVAGPDRLFDRAQERNSIAPS